MSDSELTIISVQQILSQRQLSSRAPGQTRKKGLGVFFWLVATLARVGRSYLCFQRNWRQLDIDFS
jgi:hypothetical protein